LQVRFEVNVHCVNLFWAEINHIEDTSPISVRKLLHVDGQNGFFFNPTLFACVPRFLCKLVPYGQPATTIVKCYTYNVELPRYFSDFGSHLREGWLMDCLNVHKPVSVWTQSYNRHSEQVALTCWVNAKYILGFFLTFCFNLTVAST